MITLLSLAPWLAAGECSRAGERPQIMTFNRAEFTLEQVELGTWEFFDDNDFTGTDMAT